ncbi:MAG: dihydroneopterin aldolase [Myxococcota bacterium]
MQDIVYGEGFSYPCAIGFHEYELHIQQKLEIDFEAHTRWRDAARRDAVENLVDYYEVNRAIGALIASRSWKLIEAIAEAVAELICTRFPVDRVRVKVRKTPFDMPNVRGVAVECWRDAADFSSATAED